MQVLFILFYYFYYYYYYYFLGLGVAMGNAVSALKDVSDYVGRTNDNHGIAHVIYKFFFNIENY
jgi:hydroxymethylpyrimidine pyrophosphatase-like HAD family hydrolase